MIETIILAGFFDQLRVLVTIGIFLAIFSEVSKSFGNLVGFFAGLAAAYLVYRENSWYIIAIILLTFYFGYHILTTITGNIKRFFGI